MKKGLVWDFVCSQRGFCVAMNVPPSFYTNSKVSSAPTLELPSIGELAMALEEEFDVEIYEDEAEKMTRVKDAVELVERKLREKKSSEAPKRSEDEE